MSDKEGLPFLGLSADRYRISALGPAREPLCLGGGPGVTEEPVAPQHEAVVERESVCIGPCTGGHYGGGGITVGLLYGGAGLFRDFDSTTLPPSPFGEKCAPSQASTVDSGRLGHLA